MKILNFIFLIILTTSVQVFGFPAIGSPEYSSLEKASMKEAVKLFPDSGKPGSPLHTSISNTLQKIENDDPHFIDDPNWPVLIARICNAQLKTLDTQSTPKAKPSGFIDADATQAKLSSIIIPKVEFHDATVREALNFISTKAKEVDPQKIGVPIFYNPTTGQISEDARLTVSLQNIPEFELLRYIGSLSKLRLTISKEGVTLVSEEEPIRTLITKSYSKVYPQFFGKTIFNDKQCILFFEENGVTFPDGSFAKYNANRMELSIRNTADNLKLIDTLISVWYDSVKLKR